MNRIFKVIKNRSTGVYTVASELAKGAKKGSAAAGLVSLFSLISANVYATGVPQGYTPAANDNQVGKVTISSSGNLDLGQGQGFASAQKGEEVKRYTLKSDNSVTELYNIKYKAVADAQSLVNSEQVSFNGAQSRYNQAQSEYNQVNSDPNATDAQKQEALQRMQAAHTAMQEAETRLNSAQGGLQTAQANAAAISDSKFKVDDPNGLLSTRTAGVTSVKEDRWRYRDIITGQQIQLEVIKELKEVDNSTAIQGGGLEFTFYEKMPSDNQYENLKMIEVNGSGTTVDVVNNGSADNANLTAITKGGGVIDVNDGANLNYNTNTNYYTGSGASTSLPFKEQDVYTSAASTTLYGVTYGGTINTIIGTRTINSLADFNNFNRDLKQFIQNNEQIRLDYPTKEKMQALYDSEIAKAYTTDNKGTYTITYNVERSEVDAIAEKAGQKDQFNNRVTAQDTNDIGLKGTDGNYFIGVKGSGSTITIAEGATISNRVGVDTSAGVVIKGDFDTSAETAQNTYNINGTVIGNNASTQNSSSTSTVRVKNAIVNVAATGEINGAVVITGSDETAKANKLTNDGKITGNTYMENGSIVNNNEMGSITGNNVKVDNNTGAKMGNVEVGDNSQVTNDGAVSGSIRTGKNSTVVNKANSTVGGSVVVQDGSSIQNDADAVIKGVVVANGESATFNNQGTINGSVNAVGGATGTNAATLVSEGTNDVIKLETGSKATNTGHIYIGYKQNPADATTDPNQIVVSNSADNYTAINVIGKNDTLNKASTFETDGNSKIYLAGNQTRAVAVSVSDGGVYTATETAEIILNNEGLIPVSTDPADSTQVKLESDLGNANTAVLVKDEGSTADIKGKITLKDSGSTALKVQNGADVVFSGTVNLEGKNVDNNSITNIGLHSENEGSTLTMNGSAVVNINADRGIGVHVRDGGKIIVNDNAGVTFSDDKLNQVGFLISGITTDSSSGPAIEYNSSKDMTLKGDGSVLMRIERGSKFDSNTIGGSNPPAVFDSNNAKNSTLMLITSGAVASPAVQNWQTKADLSNFTLKVSGEGAKGVAVQGGAIADITASTTLSVAGEGATLAEIDGKYYDLNGKETHNSLHNTHAGQKSILNSAAVLNANSFAATNSTGYLVKNGGELHHSGKVDFTGASNNNIGVKVVDGGKLINNVGSLIKVKGTAVEVSGNASEVEINSTQADSPIVWAIGTGDVANPGSAYHLKDQASLKLTGAGLTKAEGNAHAILVDGASKVLIDSAVIDVLGTGNGIENRSALGNIQFTNNATINVADGIGIHSGVGFSSPQQTNGVINVTGSGTGIKFEKIDPTTGLPAGNTDVAIQNTGFESVVINVRGANGKGIEVHSTQNVLTSASVNVMDTNGHAALIVKGTSENVTQRGNLQSTSSNPIVSLNDNVKNFTNEGKLLSGTFAGDTFTATKDETKFALKQQAGRIGLNFTNRGEINNTVELLGKNADGSGNVVTLANGSKGELFKTGNGRDTFNINRVTGTDVDGATKQFAKLDGGAESDNVWFSDRSNFTINNADTIQNIEFVGVRDGSTLTLNNLSNMLNGATEYNISDAASTLVYNKDSAANVDAKLTGNGTFLFNGDVTNNTARQDLNFIGSSHTGGTFGGTVEITNADLDLAGINTTALTNAELKASANSEVEVQSGTQTIRKLNFNGGLVDFNDVALTDPVTNSANHVSATDLHLGSGKVRVDLATPGSMANSKPLMEQDDAGMMSKLASSANAVTGSADNLELVDKNGNPIPSSIKTDINQDGVNQVARVSYESKLTTEGTTGHGLYLRYGIDTVELKEKDVNGLKLDGSGKTGLAAELKAKVTDFDNGDGTKTEGDLQIVGNSEVTLNNTANDYHGKTLVKDSATLKAGSNNALGNTKELNLAANTGFDLNGKTQTVGALNTAADSTANLNGGNLTVAGLTDSTVNGKLEGAGNLTVNDKTVTVNGSNVDLTAKVTVGADDTKAATVNANKVDSLGTGEINIKEKAEVNVTLAQAVVGSAVEIANKLTGTGQYNFNGDGTGAGQTEVGFKAGTNTGGTFEGEVELTNAKLNLSGDNTDALTNAELKASNNSLVNVGAGKQTINTLTFNGGTVNFQDVGLKQVDPVALAAHNIAVTDLNLGSGNVQVDIAPTNGLVGGLSLLEQDNDSMKARLVQSTNDINGSAANVTLVDKNGAVLPNPTKQLISQNGEDVARASYGTELSVSGDKKGLDLSMGITKVELKAQGDNALKLDATGKSNKDAELVVQVTDFDNGDGTKTEGDLQIVGSGTVTLNNATNDYHGKTLVKDTATLKAGSDNALGNTKELNLAADTGFDLNGKTQTVGALNTAADSTVNVKGGNLTIAGLADSTVNGTLSGAGNVTVNDKTLTVNGSNTGLTAKVTVGEDDTKAAKVEANQIDSLGTGEINIKEKAEVNVTLAQAVVGSAVEIANKLTGTGQYNFNGDGTGAGQTEVGFKAGTNTGGTFEGEVELTNAKLNLSGDNTDALTNAELKASNNSLVNVGAGAQTIDTLTFNGGTVNFGDVNVSQADPIQLANNHIKVTDLNLDTGNVQIGVGAPKNNAGGSLSLMEQDNDAMKARLIQSENDINGTTANIKLIDKDGNVLPSPTKMMIEQNGEDVARASYGNNLSVSTDKKGLDLELGLTKVELKAQGDNALKLDATGKSNKDAELVVQVTDFDNGDGTKTEGDLQIVGSGEVTLNNTANDYHGKTLVKDTATLKAGSNNALGNTKELNLAANTGFDLNGKTQTVGALNTAADSTTDLKGGNLTIAGLENSTVNGTLKGAGDLTVNDKTVTVNGSNADLTAKVTVGADDTKAATVNTNKVDSLGTGEINIKEKAEVNVTLAQAVVGSAVEIANKLTGTGQYNFNGDGTGAGQTEVGFKAGTNTGGTFEGEVELTNAKLNLSGDNTDALTNATLKVSDNTLVNVGDKLAKAVGSEVAQTINALTLNGGLLDFGSVNLGTTDVKRADNNIVVDTLKVESGSDSKVRVDVAQDADTGLVGGIPLLQQDDSSAMKARLITAANIDGVEVDGEGKVTNIKVVDENGNPTNGTAKVDLKQNAEEVARAIYDAKLTKDNDGLNIEHKLKEVQLKVTGDNALKLDSSTATTDKAKELTAKLTDFVNDDGSKTAGDLQIVGSGTVTLNNATNDYSGKTLVKDTATLKAGSDNALGNTKELNLAADTGFDLNGKTQTVGALNTAQDSTVNINNGALTISGLVDSVVNGSLLGGGSVQLNNGNLTVNSSNTQLSADVIVGNDDTTTATVNVAKLDSLGSGAVKLNNDAVLNIAVDTAGSLSNAVISSDPTDTEGQLNKNGAETLTMSATQAQYYGKTNVNEGTLVLEGTTTDTVKSSQVNVKANTVLAAVNDVTLEGNVNNSGTFHIGHLPNSTDYASSVTVGGYQGSTGSKLVFNGNLGGDNSPFNTLKVTGNTAGSSVINVNNIAGTGEETKNGIKIIEVAGDSNAKFTLSDRLSAGAYDYRLLQKANNWYLSSKGGLKPEIGSHLSNLVAANTMFDLRLHDRLGEPAFTDNYLEKAKWPAVWAKARYDYSKFGDDRGQLSNKLHNRTIQIGADIARWSDDDENLYLVGLMGGHGVSNSKTRNPVTGYESKGKLTGFSWGVYATMYANNKDQTGLYADTWVLWNEFKGTVSGSKSTSKYDLSGLSASLELGYTTKFEGKGEYNYFLQPKAQIIYSGVEALDSREGGAWVSARGKNVRTRLGLKAFMNNKSPNAEKVWQAFVELNWLHNAKPYKVALGSTKVTQGGVKNIGEVKLGLERKSSKNTDFWINASYQFGSQRFNNTSVQAGVKYSF